MKINKKILEQIIREEIKFLLEEDDDRHGARNWLDKGPLTKRGKAYALLLALGLGAAYNTLKSGATGNEAGAEGRPTPAASSSRDTEDSDDSSDPSRRATSLRRSGSRSENDSMTVAGGAGNTSVSKKSSGSISSSIPTILQGVLDVKYLQALISADRNADENVTEDIIKTAFRMLQNSDKALAVGNRIKADDDNEAKLQKFRYTILSLARGRNVPVDKKDAIWVVNPAKHPIRDARERILNDTSLNNLRALKDPNISGGKNYNLRDVGVGLDPDFRTKQTTGTEEYLKTFNPMPKR